MSLTRKAGILSRLANKKWLSEAIQRPIIPNIAITNSDPTAEIIKNSLSQQNKTSDELSKIIDREWKEEIYTKTKTITANPWEAHKQGDTAYLVHNKTIEATGPNKGLIRALQRNQPEICELLEDTKEGETEYYAERLRTSKREATEREKFSYVTHYTEVDYNTQFDNIRNMIKVVQDAGSTTVTLFIEDGFEQTQIRKIIEYCNQKNNTQWLIAQPRKRTYSTVIRQPPAESGQDHICTDNRWRKGKNIRGYTKNRRGNRNRKGKTEGDA